MKYAEQMARAISSPRGQRIAREELEQIERALATKAWDEDKHPRHPAGSAEGGQFTSSSSGLGPIGPKYDDKVRRIWKAAEELGFPSQRVNTAAELKEFTIGGTRYRTGGEAHIFDDGTFGQITIYPNNIGDSDDDIKAIIAHEVGHIKFQTFLNAFKLETQTILRDGAVPATDIAFDGSLRAVSKVTGQPTDYAKRFPLYTRFGKYMGYVASPLRDRLAKGAVSISEYSRSWWAAYDNGSVKWEQALHEAFAEVERHVAVPKPGSWIPPTWRDFHSGVNKWYEKQKK